LFHRSVFYGYIQSLEMAQRLGPRASFVPYMVTVPRWLKNRPFSGSFGLFQVVAHAKQKANKPLSSLGTEYPGFSRKACAQEAGTLKGMYLRRVFRH
jgi:hypothetical protein